jgi:hypothetical protein
VFSSRGPNSVSSPHQGRKAREKDRRIGGNGRSPIGSAGKGRTKMRTEGGDTTINPDLPK